MNIKQYLFASAITCIFFSLFPLHQDTFAQFTGGSNDGFTANAYCPGSLNGSPKTLTLNSVTGYSSFCNNASKAFSITASNGYATYYYWTVPAKATILTGQGTTAISVAFGDTAGVVSVTAYNGCETLTKSITVTPSACNPAMPGGSNDGFTANAYCPGNLNGSPKALMLNSVTGYTNFCNYASEAYSISAASGYADYYYWTVPAKATILTGQGTTAISVAFGDTAGTVTVNAYNSCETKTADKNITPTNCNVSVPGGSNDGFTANAYCPGSLNGSPAALTLSSVTGYSSFCNYASEAYSISASNGYATYYYWTVPAKATILTGQGTTAISVAFGDTAGTVTVNAYNSCETKTATKNITPTNCSVVVPGGSNDGFSMSPYCSGNLNGSGVASLKLGAITGPAFTPNASYAYNVSVVSGNAVNYYWTVPTGASILTGQGTKGVTVQFGSQSGIIKVTATSVCGTDSVMLDLACPVVADAGKDTTICNGASVTLKASGGISYKWNTGNTADTLSTLTVSPTTTTTYTVDVSDGKCSKSASVKVTVNTLSGAAVSGNTSVCPGDSTVLTASGGTTYLWSNGATTAGIVLKPAQDTSLTVKVSNSCTDTTITVSVTLFNSSPVISGDSSICAGDSTVLTATGGTSYTWSSGATTASITLTPSNDTLVSVTVKNGACSGSRAITVKVSNKPVADAGTNQTICIGNNVQLNGNAGTQNSGILWIPSTGLNNDTIINPIVETQNLLPLPKTISYILSVTNGACTVQDSVSVTVNPLPVLTATPVSATVNCGDTVQLSVSGTPGLVLQKWAPSTGLNNDTIYNPVVKTQNIATLPKTITYIVTGTDTNGCSNKDTVVLTVNPLQVVATASAVSITEGDSVSLSATGAQNYTWTPSTGLSSNGISNPVAKLTATIVYIVTGTNAGGCSGSDTVTITVKPKEIPDSCNLFVPNAFSPNKNGLNETFRVRLPEQCVKEILFTVYDRWGTKVFETSDRKEAVEKGWDGTYKGTALNTGVYVYCLKITLDGESEARTVTGNITLLK